MSMSQEGVGTGGVRAGCGVEDREGAWGCSDGSVWDTGDGIGGQQETSDMSIGRIDETISMKDDRGGLEQWLGGEGQVRLDVEESHLRKWYRQ
jgi:hypothetical protein